MAWWGEGSKRVSDCPLGDEAKERERVGGWGGGGDALSRRPPIALLAATHGWEGVRGGGTGDASLMLQCLLTQQTQQGAFHPCLAALAQLKPLQSNVAM